MSFSRRPLLHHSDNNSVSTGSPIATNIDLNAHFDRRPIQTAGNKKKNLRSSCLKAADHEGTSCALFKKFEQDNDEDYDKMGEYNLFASEKQFSGKLEDAG